MISPQKGKLQCSKHGMTDTRNLEFSIHKLAKFDVKRLESLPYNIWKIQFTKLENVSIHNLERSMLKTWKIWHTKKEK